MIRWRPWFRLGEKRLVDEVRSGGDPLQLLGPRRAEHLACRQPGRKVGSTWRGTSYHVLGPGHWPRLGSGAGDEGPGWFSGRHPAGRWPSAGKAYGVRDWAGDVVCWRNKLAGPRLGVSVRDAGHGRGYEEKPSIPMRASQRTEGTRAHEERALYLSAVPRIPPSGARFGDDGLCTRVGWVVFIAGSTMRRFFENAPAARLQAALVPTPGAGSSSWVLEQWTEKSSVAGFSIPASDHEMR